MSLFNFPPASEELRLLREIASRISAIERLLKIDTTALATLITMERKTMLDISALKAEVAALPDLDASITKLAAGYTQSIAELKAQLDAATANAAAGNSGVMQADLDALAAQIKAHEEALSAITTAAAATPAAPAGAAATAPAAATS